MTWFTDFYRSTVGKKVVMAISGVALFLFLIGHMLGNLQVYLGPDPFDGYAASLKKLGPLLWLLRGSLLVFLLLHVWSAYALWRISAKARPVKYAKWTPDASSYASRTMRWTGPLVGTYLAYHLAHFTFGVGVAGFDPHDVFATVVTGFRNPYLAGLYILAMGLLVFHLYHAIWSFLQTLGVNHPRYNSWRRLFAMGMAFAIGAGFIAVPVGVLVGWVR